MNIRRTKSDIKYIFVIFVVFAISRLVFHIVYKIDFEYDLVNYLIQYLDPEILRKDFFESILYLHSQPPFFNFLIGLIELTIPEYSFYFFFILFVLTGLLTSIYLFKLMIYQKISKIISFILVVIYMLIPPTILYENFFFYTHLITFFMIMSGYFLLSFLMTDKPKHIILHFIFLSLCALTTSFFHLFWYISLVYLVIYFSKDKRTIILYSLLPLVIILFVYSKNLVLFDSFSSSSWLGINLSRISVHQLPIDLRTKLAEENRISKIAVLSSFPDYSELNEIGAFEFDSSGISALDQSIKKSGKTNYNHLVYLTISKVSLHDVKFVIFNYPEYYFEGVWSAFNQYFIPPNNFNLLENNAQKIRKYNRFFNAFFYGSSPNVQIGLFSIILIPMLIIFGVFQIFNKNVDKNEKIILIFIIANILYVMILGNLLEYGENNRFRNYTEIFHFILIGMVITRFWVIVKPNNRVVSKKINPFS